MTILLIIAVLILGPVALGQRFRIVDLMERNAAQQEIIHDLATRMDGRRDGAAKP
jgi:hypothetical protein